MADIELVIKIPEELKEALDNAKEVNAIRYIHAYNDTIYNAIKNGIPKETVTEFADRCKECGAKYGRLLKQDSKTDILDKIRDEIENAVWEDVLEFEEGDELRIPLLSPDEVFEIIDKYRVERKTKNDI